VALLAGLCESCRHVIGIAGALVVLQMTTHAGGAGQVVVVVNVAVSTLARWDLVSAGQREAGRVVIELRVEPRVGAMACRTRGGESAGNVVWICCRSEIRSMA